jgi:hypothetical protein
MAGRQLRDMLTDLRAEIGHSTNVAHGINDRDTLIYYLNRTQVQLYQDYDWPQLIIDRDIGLVDGQRYYPYPPDLAFDDIGSVHVLVGSFYQPLTYGIGPREMTILNSAAGFKQFPTLKWMHHADDNTLEVWPVPDASAVGAVIPPVDPPPDPGLPRTVTANPASLRLRGTKTIRTMVDDSDISTLPDNLIVLFSAVEILQRDDAKDAALKLNKANEAMRRHRVRQFSHKHIRSMAIGSGGGDAQSRHHYPPAIGLDYIPVGYGSGPGS